MNELPYKPIHL